MQTPTRSTINALCRLVREEGFREEHHSIGTVLELIRNRKSELEQVEDAILWLMQDNKVTISMYLGPAIKQLSRKAAEAALEEAKQSTTGRE